MAQILVRNLDEQAKNELRIRAAQHQRSLEAEVRSILTAAIASPDDDPVGDLLTRLRSPESREEPVIPEDPADHSAPDFG